MERKRLIAATILGIFSFELASCANPYKTPLATAAGAGGTTGAILSTTSSHSGSTLLLGSAAGGAMVGVTMASMLMANHPDKLAEQLNQQGMQVIRLGDFYRTVIPSDDFFYINSARLRYIPDDRLDKLITFLNIYPTADLKVTGYTDDIGSAHHSYRLSNAQAESIAAYLWANGIDRSRLHPHGAGKHHTVGSNRDVRSSAHNRRVEITFHAPSSSARPDTTGSNEQTQLELRRF